MDDDEQVELLDEFDPVTGVGRGTGVAAAHAANIAARLAVTSFRGPLPSPRLEWADEGRSPRLIDRDGHVRWDPRAQPWFDTDGTQVWPRPEEET